MIHLPAMPFFFIQSSLLFYWLFSRSSCFISGFSFFNECCLRSMDSSRRMVSLEMILPQYHEFHSYLCYYRLRVLFCFCPPFCSCSLICYIELSPTLLITLHVSFRKFHRAQKNFKHERKKIKYSSTNNLSNFQKNSSS